MISFSFLKKSVATVSILSLVASPIAVAADDPEILLSNETTFSADSETRIEISNSDLQSSNNFSIEAWVKHSGDSKTYGTIVARGGNDDGGFNLYVSGTNDHLGLWRNGGKTFYKSSASIPENIWTHVVWTQDSNDTARIYVNGVLQDAKTGWNIEKPSSTLPIGLGSWPTYNWGFDGMLRDIGMWDSALTSEEVSSLYSKEQEASEPEIESLNENFQNDQDEEPEPVAEDPAPQFIQELENFDNLNEISKQEIQDNIEASIEADIKEALTEIPEVQEIAIKNGKDETVLNIDDVSDIVFAFDSDKVEALQEENQDSVVISPFTVIDVGNDNKASALYMIQEGLNPLDPDPCGDGVSVNDKAFFNINCDKDNPLSAAEKEELLEGEPQIQINEDITYSNKFTVPLSGQGNAEVWAARIEDGQIVENILVGTADVESRDALEVNLPDGEYALNIVTDDGSSEEFQVVTVNSQNNPLPEPSVKIEKATASAEEVAEVTFQEVVGSIFDVFNPANRAAKQEARRERAEQAAEANAGIQVSGSIGEAFTTVKLTYKSVVLSSVVMSDANGYFEAEVPKDELRDLAQLFDSDFQQDIEQEHSIFVYSEDRSRGYVSPYSRLRTRF